MATLIMLFLLLPGDSFCAPLPRLANMLFVSGSVFLLVARGVGSGRADAVQSGKLANWSAPHSRTRAMTWSASGTNRWVGDFNQEPPELFLSFGRGGGEFSRVYQAVIKVSLGN